MNPLKTYDGRQRVHTAKVSRWFHYFL